MSQFFQINPENPQQRLINQACEIINQNKLAILPTESIYTFACKMKAKDAIEKIKHIRKLDDKHNLTLLCSDLSEISQFAKVSNVNFKLLKNVLPGAYTFIFEATKEVPKLLQTEKKKTIGVRISDNKILQAILQTIKEPLLCSSLILPGDKYPMQDIYEIRDVLEKQVDLIVDGGFGGLEPSSVIDLTNDEITIIRQGSADLSLFK